MANYDAEVILVTTPPAPASTITYYMRAYDGTLGRYVMWTSTTIDATGATYTGPGPLTGIVVANVVGA